MSEMADNFGPIPVSGFQGVNPEFASLQEVYYYMLQELKEASMELDVTITNPSNVQSLDPAYGYDYVKWKKYANSMRMRLAMRLSEVDESKAREEFEDAVSNGYIETMDEAFSVTEKPGWDPLTGVMSREWNGQFLSPTLNNLYIGLGGIETEEILPARYHDYVKDENWIQFQVTSTIDIEIKDTAAKKGTPPRKEKKKFYGFTVIRLRQMCYMDRMDRMDNIVHMSHT